MRTCTSPVLGFYGRVPGPLRDSRNGAAEHDLFFVLGITVDHQVVRSVWIFADAHAGLQIFPVDLLRHDVDMKDAAGMP